MYICGGSRVPTSPLRHSVDEAHYAGVKVLDVAESTEEARKAAEVGVVAIIAEAIEADGHVATHVRALLS